MLTPSAYESHVAKYYEERGYQTQVTSYSNDYGLDVLAENGTERLAIQAKLYGHTSRQVNRQMMMELHGVKDYFDCDRAVLATDGVVRQDAWEVADKLNIEILLLSAASLVAENLESEQSKPGSTPVDKVGDSLELLSFESIWERYVIPLAGTTLTADDGRTNHIVRVDWSGLERLTSNGKKSRIDIEIFKLTILKLLREGQITRDEINQNYAKRASSGVVLVLSQAPCFQLEKRPLRLVYDVESWS